MRLFKQFRYALTKNDSESIVISRILDVLNNFCGDCDQNNTLLYLSDMGENFKKSGVDRIVKAHPYLKNFEFMNSEMSTSPVKCLSNFSIEWAVGNPNANSMPISNEVLKEIVDGIPRRYPLNFATIIFDSINWHGNGKYCDRNSIPSPLDRSRSFISKKPLAEYGFLSSCIIFQSNWWITKRHKMLWAIVELEPPKDDFNEIYDLNDKIKLNLSKLGNIRNELMIIAPTEEEKRVFDEKNQVAEQVLINIDKELMDFVNNATLPYEENDNDLSKRCTLNIGVSVKKSINKTFKLRGYNYYSNYSGQGIYTIAKRTDYNSQIRLVFDVGSWGGRLSCNFLYEGHLWLVEFGLRICNGIHNKTCYFSDQNDVDRIVENVGIIVDYLENTIIIKLKSIFGRVPLWYKYQK